MEDIYSHLVGQRYRILSKDDRHGPYYYKAFDDHLERIVGIKVINSEEFAPDTSRKYFELEAKILAQLDHPNIIQIYDYMDDPSTPFIVGEYVEGSSLQEKIGEPFACGEAAGFLVPIAHALSYLHKRGFIHRDVKPSNIIISKNGRLVLSGFGMAKTEEIEGVAGADTPNSFAGTPAYISPEQILEHKCDARSDIYSLGLIFYELITGRRPFHDGTPMGLMVKRVHEPLPNPHKYIDHLPKYVEKVLLRALKKDPSDRYQAMDDFAQDLEFILKGDNSIGGRLLWWINMIMKQRLNVGGFLVNREHGQRKGGDRQAEEELGGDDDPDQTHEMLV